MRGGSVATQIVSIREGWPWLVTYGFGGLTNLVFKCDPPAQNNSPPDPNDLWAITIWTFPKTQKKWIFGSYCCFYALSNIVTFQRTDGNKLCRFVERTCEVWRNGLWKITVKFGGMACGKKLCGLERWLVERSCEVWGVACEFIFIYSTTVVYECKIRKIKCLSITLLTSNKRVFSIK